MSLRKNDRDNQSPNERKWSTIWKNWSCWKSTVFKGVSVNMIFFVSRGAIEPSNTSVLILSPTLHFEKHNSFFQTATVMIEIPGDLAGFQLGAHLFDGSWKIVTQVVLWSKTRRICFFYQPTPFSLYCKAQHCGWKNLLFVIVACWRVRVALTAVCFCTSFQALPECMATLPACLSEQTTVFSNYFDVVPWERRNGCK